MTYLLMGLFAALVVAADQITKYLISSNLDLGQVVPVWDGVVHLTRVHNYGAAFSSFQGMRWLFAVVFLVFTVAIIWEFSKKRMGFSTFDRWCIISMFAGGLGNMIDRMWLGYVVDMIEVEFVNFAVFNVADCFVTCGSILLLVHLIFFNKEFWKDGKQK